jgi:Bacterial Ig-like domain (group 1)
MLHLRRFGRLWLAIGIAGCTADSLVLPGDGAPAHISILEGDLQTGTAGSPLSDSLIVEVTDGQSRAVVDLPLTVVPPAGSAVSPAQVKTDASGQARFRWVLGPTSGSQSLSVRISGETQPTVTFHATAQPGPVQDIAAVSGDGQTGAAGSPLTLPLVVRLLDSFGNGVEGANVIWQPTAGRLDKNVSATGPDGSASVIWTLGSGSGLQTVKATFNGAASSPITFRANAVAGASPRLEVTVQPSTSGQSGILLSRQPSIRLESPQGSPISRAGVAVTAAIASGGGSLTGTSTVPTDATGLARFTNLAISGTPGPRTLIFAAVGYTAATSSAIDLSAPVPSPSRSTISVTPGSILVNNEVATITVTARDNAGTPIAGLAVTLAVSGTGNSVTQPSARTNASGVATGTVFSTVPGTKSVAAQIENISVSQTATINVVSSGPAGPSAQHSTANVPNNAKRFRVTVVRITTKDAAGNNLQQGGFAGQILVDVNGANQAHPAIVDQGDGTYEASYVPLFKGDDWIEVKINGVKIPGSPFKSKVK